MMKPAILKRIMVFAILVSATVCLASGTASAEIWQRIHSQTSEAVAVGDMDGNGQDDIAIDFGNGYGVYALMNNNYWKWVHNASPVSLTFGNIDGVSGKDLIVDFGASYGIWIYYNNSTWKQLHAKTADAVITYNLDGNNLDDIIIDFGEGYGVYAYLNGTSWFFIHNASPKYMAGGDFCANGTKGIVLDFGPGYGIWTFNGLAWAMIHSQTSDGFFSTDLDNNTHSDIVVDFGPTYGVYAYMNGASWQFIHGASPKSMAAGNTDSNAKQELIADFGAQYGVWVLCNGEAWRQLHPQSTVRILTCKPDSGAKDSVLIDFGSQYGIWLRSPATPDLTITSPQNNAMVTSSPATVIYKIDMLSKSQDFILTPGINLLTVTDVDALGNTGSASVTVSYTPMLPSIVTTNGYQVIVQKRNPDNTLGAAEPYAVKGVNWSPASIGTVGPNYDETGMRSELGKWCDTDIPLMAAMNANTIRTFQDFGLTGDYPIKDWKYILDKCYEHNIMVILTVDRNIADLSRTEAIVNQYKNHPAVLMWLVGNEWTINKLYNAQPDIDSCAQAVQNVAVLIKSLDGNHPVATSVGDLNHPSFDTMKDIIKNKCPSVDVWCFNLYRGKSFSNLFDQWRDVAAFYKQKPMIISEFGCDAYDSNLQSEDQTGQRTYEYYQWKEISSNLSGLDQTKVCAGGCVFEFNDEWWKTGNIWGQDSGGWSTNNCPDGFASEEWWGLVDIDRNPRQAYHLFKEYFGGLTPEPPPSSANEDYNVVRTSTQPDTITTNIQTYIVADVFKNAATVKVNGTAVTLDGYFGFRTELTLNEGTNNITIEVIFQDASSKNFVKTVIYDPNYSTGIKKLLYAGAAVIDLDQGACIGKMPALITAISHNGKYIVDNGGNVYSSATNKAIGKKLNFTQGTTHHPVFSIDDKKVFSHYLAVDFDSNAVLTAALPADITDDYGSVDDAGYLYFGQYGNFKKIDPLTYALVTDLSGLSLFAYSSKISRDGTLYFGSYFASANSMFYIMDTSTNSITQLSLASDYAGEIAEAATGGKVFLGSYGNSYYGKGGVYVIDTSAKTVLSYYKQYGARRIACSSDNIFTTSTVVDHFGNGSLVQGSVYHRGVEVLKLGAQDKLDYEKSYFIGLSHDYNIQTELFYKQAYE